jgi:PAS domain S-box-containing protein
VEFKDRLLMLGGENVPDVKDVQRVMTANGYQPIEATFEKPDGQVYSISVTPIRPPFADLISMFGIPYLVGLQLLMIGFWAYRIKPNLWESRALTVFTSGVCIMLATFLDISMTHNATILWSLAILLSAGGMFHLALVFPQPVQFVRANPGLRYLPWFLMALLVPVMVVAVYFPPTPFFYISAWQIGYVCFILGFITFITILVWRIIRSRSPIVRQQSRVILFGIFLGFLPIIIYAVSLITGSLMEFHAWLIFPPLVLFPLSITYAILRFRLLDVDSILVRLTTYAAMTLIVVAAFYGLLALVSFAVGKTVTANNPFLIATYLFLLVIGLTPLRSFIQSSIDRIFYRAPADYRRALTLLSRALVTTPSLSQALNLLEEQLQQALAPEKFIIHLYNDELGEYVPHATRETSAPPYQADDPLVELIDSALAPVWLHPDGDLTKSLLKSGGDYEKLRGFTFVPLRFKRRLTGFMSLGPRRSGELYNTNDLDFLIAVANQSALALENARLFENLRRSLNQTTEMKNLMDNILSSVSTGIITTDLKKNITLFNRAAENMLGVSGDKVMGKPLASVLPELSAELYTVNAPQQKVIDLTSDTSGSSERKSMSLRLSLSPLQDANLEPKGTAIVFEDLTARSEQETANQPGIG